MKYTGALAKPAKRSPHNKLLAEVLRNESKLLEAPYNEIFAKVPELFKAHEIAVNDWQGLALALARTHVPGFKVVNPPGRKTEWDYYAKAEFRLTVDDMREANPKMPTTQAIAKVCRLPSWEQKTKGMKVTALRKHYDAADLRWVAVMRDAKAYDSIVRKD